jgi:hypothetical protein
MENLCYVVYGLKLVNESGYRYVGITTGKPKNRLSGHMHMAFSRESKLAVHCWIRKYGRESIIMKILEECPRGDWEYLTYAERYWIKSLKKFGHKLLNHTEGGEGVLGLPAWNKGVPMTKEQKEHMRILNTGKVLPEDQKELIRLGVRRHFETNGHKPVYDFWIEKYGKEEADRLREEKRKKASAKMSGEGNPMFGRSGQDAPCYGRVGDKHPMFGKNHSAEAKNKISQTQKGKKDSEATKLRKSFAQHIRAHETKIKETCRWCLGADLQNEIKKVELNLDGAKLETSG